MASAPRPSSICARGSPCKCAARPPYKPEVTRRAFQTAQTLVAPTRALAADPNHSHCTAGAAYKPIRARERAADVLEVSR